MNRRYSALALSAVAMGAVVLTTTEASATKDPGGGSTSQAVPNSSPDWPDEGAGYPRADAKGSEPNYPNYDPKYEVTPVQAATGQSASDDNAAEALQASASALGGAAVAFGGMWLYRRRHVLAG
ncbi:hypothetical protein ACFPJ1_16220 [Kribbella qitaiheensis]|uniref:hypothetical protein n=1 Tax=Kribbella qitaiheensis TaxID=1544730 RepID=UPI0036227B26